MPHLELGVAASVGIVPTAWTKPSTGFERWGSRRAALHREMLRAAGAAVRGVPAIEDARARLGVPRAVHRLPIEELVAYYGTDVAAFAAAELFVSSAELDSRRGELPGALRVLTSVGNLGRQSFNAVYREALCVLSREARNQPVDCAE